MADQSNNQPPKEKQPIILSLIPRGNPEFPRYSISDQYLRYWTGETWTEPGKDQTALLYSSSNEALIEMNRLLVVEHSTLTVTRYVAPIYIELRSEKPIPMDELKRWLLRATKLLIDSPKHGNGPVAGSLGSCRIEYGELEEITPNQQRGDT